MERKTMKVLNICDGGRWLVCVKRFDDEHNPYRLYAKHYQPGKGYRQKQIGKYADLISVLEAIKNIYMGRW